MADVRLTTSGFLKLAKNATSMREKKAREAMAQAVDNMANVYLRTAKKNTPVGQRLKRKDPKTGIIYRSDTEHMRRSWQVLDRQKKPRSWSVTVGNTASYASYVNDGHRQQRGRYVPLLGKSLSKTWVDGLNMRKKAIKATKKASNAAIRKALREIAEGVTK